MRCQPNSSVLGTSQPRHTPYGKTHQLTFCFIEGELADLIDEFSDGRIQFAFVKVKDPNSSLPKNVLIAWVSSALELQSGLY
jgi:hypothetical protein